MKCLAIAWNEENRVVGAVLEKVRHADKPVLVEHIIPTASMPFPEQLAEAYNQLNANDIDLIILGGHMDEAVCFELAMPKLSVHELRNALAFELPRQLPCGTEALSVFYRQIGGGGDSTLSLVRIFAVKSRVWEQLLSHIAIAGITADVVCHPFMAADPVFAGKDIYLPEVEKGVIFSAPSDQAGLRQVTYVSATAEKPCLEYQELFHCNAGTSADIDHLLSAGLLGAYGLGAAAADRRSLSPLPDNLRPQRCKFLKWMAAGLALFAGILLLGLGYRCWTDAHHRMLAVKNEVSKVERLLAQQQKKIKMTEELGKITGKLLEAADEPNMLQLMGELTRILPESMWITSLRSSNRKVNLTIQAANDRDDITTPLSRLNGYMVENLRKQRNPNNTTVLYVTLAMKEKNSPLAVACSPPGKKPNHDLKVETF